MVRPLKSLLMLKNGIFQPEGTRWAQPLSQRWS